jgi:hypothetical protein
MYVAAHQTDRIAAMNGEHVRDGKLPHVGCSSPSAIMQLPQIANVLHIGMPALLRSDRQ